MHLYVEIAVRCTLLTGFTFICQPDPVTGINPCRNLNGECFLFLLTSLTMTVGAWVRDHLALTPALRAGLLYGEETLLHTNLACATTGSTGCRRGAFFGTTARACFTGD